jgi:hypothetical protein
LGGLLRKETHEARVDKYESREQERENALEMWDFGKKAHVMGAED